MSDAEYIISVLSERIERQAELIARLSKQIEQLTAESESLRAALKESLEEIAHLKNKFLELLKAPFFRYRQAATRCAQGEKAKARRAEGTASARLQTHAGPSGRNHRLLPRPGALPEVQNALCRSG